MITLRQSHLKGTLMTYPGLNKSATLVNRKNQSPLRVTLMGSSVAGHPDFVVGVAGGACSGKDE